MTARLATATVEPPVTGSSPSAREPGGRSECCALYHHAVELIGKRWSGAILGVLLDGPLRFSEIRSLVPAGASVRDEVAAIVDEVRRSGDGPLMELAERFDGVKPPLRVAPHELDAAAAGRSRGSPLAA